MEPDHNNQNIRKTGSTYIHKKAISPSEQFVKELAEREPENDSGKSTVSEIDPFDDGESRVRDSFSAVPNSNIKLSSAREPSTSKFGNVDNHKTTAFEIAQMPKGVYAIGIFGLAISILDMATAFSFPNFVIAILSFVMAMGLLLRFKTARYFTIGFAVLVVLLSLFVLIGVNHKKGDLNNSYAQQKQFIASESDSSFLPDNLQQNAATFADYEHRAKLQALRHEEIYSWINIIVYSIEAVYLLRPRVGNAFNS